MRLPRFYELPIDVGGMIQVKDQALPAVKKAAAKDVILNKGERWIENRIRDEGEEGIACSALAQEQRNGRGAVALHVLDVILHRRILQVKHMVFQLAGCGLRLGCGVWLGIF